MCSLRIFDIPSAAINTYFILCIMAVTATSKLIDNIGSAKFTFEDMTFLKD
jgi:hypothetical protein